MNAGQVVMSRVAQPAPRLHPPVEQFRLGSKDAPPAMNLSFASEDVPARDRIAVWREVYAKTIAKVDWNPIDREPFYCRVQRFGLPGLGIMSITVSGGVYRRSRAMASDGNDDFLLMAPISGIRPMSQIGREVLVEHGAATLLTAAEPVCIESPSRSRGLAIAIPSKALLPMISNRDAALGRLIPRGTAALQLLIGYIELLLQGHALTSPELQHRAVSHVYDLAALAIGATRDAAHSAIGGGVRAARLQAICADILANLSQVRLSPKMIAQRHGLTERHIHRLFEDAGQTFGEFVTEARLERALDLLRHPRAGKIKDIALGVGYGDLSTFNRAFRRRFGDTPTGIRAQAG
jgi:AraC-like DNA-binding protein